MTWTDIERQSSGSLFSQKWKSVEFAGHLSWHHVFCRHHLLWHSLPCCQSNPVQHSHRLPGRRDSSSWSALSACCSGTCFLQPRSCNKPNFVLALQQCDFLPISWQKLWTSFEPRNVAATKWRYQILWTLPEACLWCKSLGRSGWLEIAGEKLVGHIGTQVSPWHIFVSFTNQSGYQSK